MQFSIRNAAAMNIHSFLYGKQSLSQLLKHNTGKIRQIKYKTTFPAVGDDCGKVIFLL
jgi:hypothetical protein